MSAAMTDSPAAITVNDICSSNKLSRKPPMIVPSAVEPAPKTRMVLFTRPSTSSGT